MRKLGEGKKSEVFVLPDGRILKLLWPEFGHLADVEMQNLRMLARAGVSAPRVEKTVQIDGRTGIVLASLSVGRTLHDDLQARPWSLLAAARNLAELHAAIHAHSSSELPPLHGRIEQEIRASAGISEKARDLALRSLAALPDGVTVCHNDFHARNVIIAPGGSMIIDWARAARGNPLADVAVAVLQLRIGERRGSLATQTALKIARAAFCRVYLRRYRELRPFPADELKRWMLPVAAAYAGQRKGGRRLQLLQLVDRLAECEPTVPAQARR